MNERRAVAQRWMDAYLRGCQEYVERGPNDPEILSILQKFTRVPAKAIKAAIPYYQDPKGKLALESLADQIAWFVANGFMSEQIGVERAADLSSLR